MPNLDRAVWIDRGWQPVAIGFVPSEKAWNHVMKVQKVAADWPIVPNSGGYTQWLQNDTTGEGIILVAISMETEACASSVISTLVHEAVHVWQFLCQHIGEKEPGIEMEAYGIENIFNGLLDAYTKTQGKGKQWP